MNAQPELHFGLDTLYDMLTYQRPAWSDGEHAFIMHFLAGLPGAEADDFGNIWVITNKNSRTLFSAHTDTVHPKPNPDHRQKLQIDATGLLSAEGKQQLGADNGVGCWILMNMIMAGVPGTYIFHRGEETGGQGSTYISTHYEEVLKTYDHAIAFDRKGTNSIITHQSFERGCSDAFAVALIEQLGMGHVLDDGGTFTDTRNYFDVIPECTNISAGYAREHTFDEHLNTIYAENLAKRCVAMDWAALPALRDPTVVEFADDFGFSPNYGSPNYGSRNWAAYGGYSDDIPGYGTTGLPTTTCDMHTLVYEHPEEIAEYLLELGFEPVEVWDAIKRDVQWNQMQAGRRR